MGDYDRSSKWLIQHYGKSLLRLAGFETIEEWRAVQAEVVQPTQLPDGLIEARLAGQETPAPFVVEIATYPETRTYRQLARDGFLVYLDRDELPEILVVLLHPRGDLRVTDSFEINSKLKLTKVSLQWRVVELWNLDAEELLATNDPGLMPWVSLTKFDGPPEPVLKRCRRIIDERARAEERANLLAVSQVLAKLRFDDDLLLKVFGGKQAMIESPLIKELTDEAEAKGRAEGRQEDILDILEGRFGAVPEDLAEAVRALDDEKRLREAITVAVQCQDLEAFRVHLRTTGD